MGFFFFLENKNIWFHKLEKVKYISLESNTLILNRKENCTYSIITDMFFFFFLWQYYIDSLYFDQQG